MSNSMLANPTAHNIAYLTPKLTEDDPDLRFMALNDLSQLLTAAPPTIFQADYAIAAKTVDALILAFQDKNGEVQNMAIKCIGPFVNKVNETVLCALIDKVSQLPSENVVDSTIPALVLRSMVVSLPHPVQGIPRSPKVIEAYNAISRALIPRLTGYIVKQQPKRSNDLPKPPVGMLTLDMQKGSDSSAIDVLIEVARCFGFMLQPVEVSALAKISIQVIQHDRTSHVLKKKAVQAFSTLAIHFSDGMWVQFMSQINDDLKRQDLTRAHRKLYFTLLASIARSIPQKFSPFLKDSVPFALVALSQEEIDRDSALVEETEERDPETDEVREAAMLAIESWLSVCPLAMQPFTKDCLKVMVRFLKYDPNLADAEEDDEMDDGDEVFDGDEDFEEDFGGDDEDDTSWRVRRCAAKVAHVLIATRSQGDLLEDGTLYSTVAPALVSRFKEREETVRLEVLSALALLVRITGGDTSIPAALESDVSTSHGSMGPPASRKRRRGGSDVSIVDGRTGISLSVATDPQTIPSISAMASLESLSKDIVLGISQLMQTAPLPSKQASIGLLKDLIVSLRGKLTDSGYLPSTMDSIIGAFKPQSAHVASGSSLTAANAYRVEALQFLGAAAEVQSSQDLDPYLPRLLPAITNAMNDRYIKVSTAALNSVEHYIDMLTPPRSIGSKNQQYLKLLNTAIVELCSTNDVDLDIRRLAIHALGKILGQSSGTPGLLAAVDRTAGMNLILSRLHNETTRLATVRAVDTIAIHARNPSDYSKDWVRSVATELGEQFRKSSRSLRGASLAATQNLAINPATRVHFGSKTVSELLPSILPLIKASDLHLLGPALLVLAAFVEMDPQNPAIQTFIDPICELLCTPMTGTTLQALITLVRVMGEQGIGKELMSRLLRDVSLKASPDMVGKIVGNLLVCGEGTIGVKMEDFIHELNVQRDEHRKCLALSVLGEAAYLMETKCTLKPQFFMERFDASEEKTAQAAAAALGRAGAGNVQTYLPIILHTIGKPTTTPKQKHLLLLSIREIVTADTLEQLASQVQDLWNEVMAASQADENRTLGAESIGRLAVVDPGTFFPQLRELLTTPGSKASLRGLILSALRVTVTSDSKAAQNKTVSNALSPLLKAVLQLIPKETDLENRRLALTVVNAATHSRMDDVLAPMIPDVVKVVLGETVIRQELVREVSMGPFKHKVDDGLEVRKAAYEALYTLLPHDALPASTLQSLISPLKVGLADDQEIRLLSLLSLHKAIETHPATMGPLLPSFIEPFKKLLNQKPREQAVKQELERMEEGIRGVIRLGLDVQRRWPEGVGNEWAEWWANVKQENATVIKGVEQEGQVEKT